MLDIKQLSRQIGGKVILDQISAQLAPGQVVALLGKNGSGKTTLLHTLLGFALPTSGSVRLWGTEAAQTDGTLRQRIGFVPQQDDLLPYATGRQQLALFRRFQPHWDNALCDRLVREWEIPLEIQQQNMSLGQRQKLSIVLALCHQPELLVLDEPVASLDPIARRQLLSELIQLAAGQDTAMLFSSHLVGDLERVASHVWLLQQGRLHINAELDTLKESVCRLRLPLQQQLPTLRGVRLLRQQTDALGQSVSLQQLEAGAFQQLLPVLAPLATEYLSLEDIFLELHG